MNLLSVPKAVAGILFATGVSLAQAAPEAYRFHDFQWAVTPPSFGRGIESSRLPDPIRALHSNNNVGITRFEGRLFLAWRTAPTHFASSKTVLYVMSSVDDGATWDYETEIRLGYDIREPHVVEIGGRLFLYAFRGGKKALEFKPAYLFRAERLGFRNWTQPERLGRPGEVPWEIKVRDGVAYMASYAGSHYSAKPGAIDVFFSRSTDGLAWEGVGAQPVVYTGGVSEVSFEWDAQDRLFAVSRNEDGDDTGWGSHFITVEPGAWGEWKFPKVSDPERYDSPRMFRHGEELYLIARRDIGGPFDGGLRDLPFNLQRWIYLADYSGRRKRTSLYYVNRGTHKIEWLEDLPSAGDNAFPSIVQLDADRYVVANYTSPLDEDRWVWIQGQLAKRGTGIYLMQISFAPTH